MTRADALRLAASGLLVTIVAVGAILVPALAFDGTSGARAWLAHGAAGFCLGVAVGGLWAWIVYGRDPP